MPAEIKLPVLGEGVDSAIVSKLLVKPGDKVSNDQTIMELETDKAAVDVPASAAGTVKEILVKEGDTIKVGQTLMTLEDSAEPAKPKEEAPKEEAAPPKEASKTEKAEKPQKTDKVEKKPEPQEEPQAEPQPEPEPEKDEEQPQQTQPSTGAAPVAPASPSLRRKARELGVDINAVKGTGPEGRITEEDVRNYARSIILNASVPESRSGSSELPDFGRWGDTERRTMTPLRRKIAENVEESWNSIPHVTQFDSADITELEETRKSHKLSITAIAIKIASVALKTYPQFNVSLNMTTAEIILKKYVNIGVAVDTEHGLLVPVIHDVDKKNIVELSTELAQLAEKARNRKLTIDEMQGGTFTVTNLGGIGGSHFTPIVNGPEVAILGISRATQQPVYVNGQFQPRLMLPLSLSYDHRAVDGADGARFLRWIAQALENPLLVL